MYLLYLQHPHHPQNFCNAVCNSQENPQEIQNSTAQRITESVRLEGVTVVHLVQPPVQERSSQSTWHRIVSGHSPVPRSVGYGAPVTPGNQFVWSPNLE